jgi:Clostripain family
MVLSVLLIERVHTTPNQSKWTLMVYMCGDVGLHHIMLRDIQQEIMTTYPQSNNVNVVVLANAAPRTDSVLNSTKLFVLSHPENANDVDWSDRDMGNPHTLIDFVQWSRMNLPAQKYILVIWGHGSAWNPNRFAWSYDSLDMHEMMFAIPLLGFIDVVAYDSCNMASIELEYMWYGYSSVISHSQLSVGDSGINYTDVINALDANSEMSVEQVSIVITNSTNDDKVWSSVVLDAHWGRLLRAFTAWTKALSKGLPELNTVYQNALNATVSYGVCFPAETNLEGFVMAVNNAIIEINNCSTSDREFELGKAKMTVPRTIFRRGQSLLKLIGDVVIYNRHIHANYSYIGGINIHVTTQFNLNDDYYQLIPFSLETGWGIFLDESNIQTSIVHVNESACLNTRQNWCYAQCSVKPTQWLISNGCGPECGL